MKFKYVVFFIFGLGLAALYISVNPSEVDFLPKCPLYKTTGLFCPGCGSQRATHQLLNFNILKALQHNILYFVGLIIFIYHGIITGINILSEKKKYNYLYHPKTPIALLIFIILFWVLRNIPVYPFTVLAP